MATRHHDVRTTGQRRPGKRRPLDPTGTPRVVAVTDGLTPGEVLPAEGSVRLNEGRETATVRVANTGDRPVQVGSHFHFFEVNAALSFDRAAAFGKRLNVPAGTAVRFEPGDRTEVELVAIGGKRRTHGTNGLVNGSAAGDPDEALERAREAGFADAAADGASGDGTDAAEEGAARSAAERSSGERSEPRDGGEDS